MSGGHFNYSEYCLLNIKEEIDKIIKENDSKETDNYGSTIGRGYDEEVLDVFKTTSYLVKLAFIYIRRLDWLLSGDDGPEDLLTRLEADLQEEVHRLEKEIKKDLNI